MADTVMGNENPEFSEERYDEMLGRIFVRYPSVQNNTFSTAYKPGLQHMVDFCSVLGNPQDSYPTVHVAGTNGKGSVSNMIAASLMEVGYRVGLYTSPHIVDFRERMRVDGKMVPKEWVYDFMTRNSETFSRLDLSFFEITTGMAFAWFAEQKVEVARVRSYTDDALLAMRNGDFGCPAQPFEEYRVAEGLKHNVRCE